MRKMRAHCSPAGGKRSVHQFTSIATSGARGPIFESLEGRTLLAATRIMPLGDSITESATGHASYRYWLWKSLQQASYDVDFIGSKVGVANGPPLFSDFDQDHEGHSGFRADQLRDSTTAWATANRPDVVLLHAGTNDLIQAQSVSSTSTELGQIIDLLRGVNANVTVLLAKIIPISGNNQVTQLNSSIGTLATNKNTAQSRVIAVDQYTGFSVTGDLYDGIHPNQSGEQKMSAKWYSTLTSVLPAPQPPQPPSGTVYLSNLNWTSATNGNGPVEKDRSSGEQAGGDGRTITLNGVTYAKGLGVHASSDVRYNLAGQYTSFLSDVGIDDEVGGGGSVKFQVFLDGATTPAYDSGAMGGNSATKQINLNVTGKTTLRLVVTDNADGNAYDHADWANARIVASGTPVSPPAAPSGLGATLAGTQSAPQINLAWTDIATDETGYKVERRTGTGGTWGEIASLSAGATSYIDSANLAFATTYYYRVYALNSGGPSGFSNEANATTPAAPPPPPPPTGTTYVSDLNWTSATNGNGPVEKDKSSGQQFAGDGRTITLNGVTYTKGLGVHAASDIRYNLAGQYASFLSDLGVDDEVGADGSVRFQVFLDGATTAAYDSGAMGGNTATKQINLDVAGRTTLRLVVTDNGDGNSYDHADWASARLLVSGTPVTPPAAPASLTASFASSRVNLAWTDVATDETGYKVERKTGAGGAWAEIASLAAGATSYPDAANLLPATTYFYRVYAVKNGTPSGYSNEASATVPAPTGQTFLSDLNWVSATNGNGPVERDMSSGERFAGDGHTIRIGGQSYVKGLGVHANSTIVYNLGGAYQTFASDIGIDDETGGDGSVAFQVWVDGVKVYDSGRLLGGIAARSIAINVAGAQELKLIVTDSGDGDAYDHADWANARVLT